MTKGNDYAHDLFGEIISGHRNDPEDRHRSLGTLASQIQRAYGVWASPETSRQEKIGGIKDFLRLTSIYYAHEAAMQQANKDLERVTAALDESGSSRQMYNQIRGLK